jgi:hypothetical protein
MKTHSNELFTIAFVSGGVSKQYALNGIAASCATHSDTKLSSLRHSDMTCEKVMREAPLRTIAPRAPGARCCVSRHHIRGSVFQVECYGSQDADSRAIDGVGRQRERGVTEMLREARSSSRHRVRAASLPTRTACKAPSTTATTIRAEAMSVLPLIKHINAAAKTSPTSTETFPSKKTVHLALLR